MIDELLHVAHLRIRSRAPLASAVGMAARIEDALRTSSMPSAWRGRVVLVRRLGVRLRERAPAHQMTREIEREWQRLARGAVEYVHASAASDAVWFPGQVEARLALIERLAAGAEVSAWFWRLLLPLDPAASVDEQLIALFAAPWTDLEVCDQEQMRFARLAFASLGSTTQAMRIVERLSTTELRRLLPSLQEDVPRRRTITEMTNVEGDGLVESASAGPESWQARARRFAFSAIDGQSPDLASSSDRTRGQASIASQPSRDATVALSGEGITSDWAGLLFVLNLLPHAGDLPAAPRDTGAILRAVATWLRIAPYDSIYEVLAEFGDDGPTPDVLKTKVRALRTACAALTRRPLRRIVARPGRILITRTHVTAVFDLKTVRLDARKAGLDLDPGWLPHLGRVVRFEYE
jgi:hypothetical protein